MSDTMSLARRADALEAKMAQELDYHRHQVAPPHAGRGRSRFAAQCRRPDEGQSQRARADGRRSAPAGDAGEADPDRLLQAPLRPVHAPPAKRPARGERRPAREDGARLPAARHRRDRLHPRRPRLLGRPADRALCRRGSDLGDPRPPGAALLSRRVGRLRISAGLRRPVRRGLPTRFLHRGRLQADAQSQMVHVGPA